METQESFLIKTDCSMYAVNPNGKAFSLDELQSYVGGFFEIIHTLDGRIMVVNENGLFEGLGVNFIASALAGTQIVGDVIVCENGLIE